MEYEYCEIVFPIPLNVSYTYYVPEEFRKYKLIGCRVKIDFGEQKNKIGVVTKQLTKEQLPKDILNKDIKPIKKLIDFVPLFHKEHFYIAEKLSYKYLVPIGKVFSSFFPIEHETVFTQPVIEKQAYKKDYKIISQISYQQIINSKDRQLLFIPTTSEQKFKFYKDMILYSITNNLQCLILFPQKSYIEDFYNYIEDEQLKFQIFVYTGEISVNERYKIWQLVNTQEINIVVSTCDGIFLPIKKNSIIIVDEPDEIGYKNQTLPLYHIKEIIEYRLAISENKIIYTTFFPSVELRYNVKKTLLLNNDKGSKNTSISFIQTIDEVKKILLKEVYKFHQCIILYPYKGYARYFFCFRCGRMFKCFSCGSPVTYITSNSEFKCKLCGQRYKSFKCSHCGNEKYKGYGVGIQKVFETLVSFLPEIKFARIDKEVPQKVHLKLIQDFNSQKIDVLVTTVEILNYIYKLYWSNISTIIFLNIDSMLYRPSYLGYENVYRLISLMKILLPKKIPTNIYLNLAKKDDNYLSLLSDATKFYRNELKIRKDLCYPPYCKLMKITFVSSKRNELEKSQLDLLVSQIRQLKDVVVFVPEEIKKVVNEYQFYVFIKLLGKKNQLDKILSILDDLRTNVIKDYDKVKIYIDYDPKEF